MTFAPDLTSYDILLLNSSAGKDSQAMLDYVVELADAQGVRDRIVVVHCDLGRVEWKGTKELAAEHAATYGLPFEIVSREKGDLLDQVLDRGMWPSSTARWCTSDQKTSQVAKLMTRLVKDLDGQVRPSSGTTEGPVRILNLLGIRAQESSARAKKASFENEKRATNGRRTVDRWLPIFDWTEDQVWARIDQAPTEYHGAYDLGMPRLSCVFCVLATRKDLVIAATHNPDLAAEYVAAEELTGHKFTMAHSIAEILAEAETPVAIAA